MKIGIISDTHMKKHFTKLEDFINKNLKDMDMIIHAGDYTSPEIISLLSNHCKFIGVYGNNDGPSIKSKVPEKQILCVEGYKIGIYHGHGDKKQTLDNVMNIFKNDKLDIIIFGHSHKPTLFTKGKTLYLNPGSTTYKRKDPWFSYIILELEKDRPIIAKINLF